MKFSLTFSQTQVAEIFEKIRNHNAYFNSHNLTAYRIVKTWLFHTVTDWIKNWTFNFIFFFCVKLTLLKIRQKFSILKVRLNCFIFTPKFHDLHGNELFHTNTFETFLDTFQPNFADILEFSPETHKTNKLWIVQKISDKRFLRKKILLNSISYLFLNLIETVLPTNLLIFYKTRPSKFFNLIHFG